YKSTILNGIYDIKSSRDFILLHLKAFWDSSKFPKENPDFFFIKDVGAQPEHVFSDFLSQFPEGKIISIRRNPRFTVRAIILDRKKNARELTFFQKLRYIYEAYRTNFQQRGYLNHPRVMT